VVEVAGLFVPLAGIRAWCYVVLVGESTRVAGFAPPVWNYWHPADRNSPKGIGYGGSSVPAGRQSIGPAGQDLTHVRPPRRRGSLEGLSA